MAKDISFKLVDCQKSIQWSGMVRLHQLREYNESKLSIVEYPPGSGEIRYICASTGLLFDQQSGKCLQSSHVDLLLDTVKPEKCTFSQFNKWVSDRQISGQKHLQLKRGPKPKGSVQLQDFDEPSEDIDYASLV